MKEKIGVSANSPFFIEQTLILYFWIENQCDSDNEKEKETKTTAKVAAKFDDEDQVDPEEIARKKKEEQRKVALEAQENGRVKKANKIDYDKAFEER